MKKNFPAILLPLMLCSFILSYCGKSGGYSNGGSNNPPAGSIGMAGRSFSPGTQTVKAGSTVNWANNDNVAHTVTADDNSFDSGSIPAGGKYSHTFMTEGTFAYHCNFHGGMTGSITVTP